MKAIFQKFGETKRGYNSNEPINVFNSKIDKNLSFFTIQENENILSADVLLSPFNAKKLNRTKFELNDLEVTFKILLPKKQKFKVGNYTTYKFKLVCVGNKRESSKLPAGLLYQLQ